jgi:hypothetical protein
MTEAIMSHARKLITVLAGLLVLEGCQAVLVPVVQRGGNGQTQQQPPQPGSVTPSATPSANDGAFIREKRTSNLSADLTTVTLSLDAADPDGNTLTMIWEEGTRLGDLNTTRGNNVQWKATAGATGTAVIMVTVGTSTRSEMAEIRIPVENGKIKLAELTPEVSLAPQSATLFRPLPTSLGLTEDQLVAMGIKTKVTLGATTFKFNPTTNEKEKVAQDSQEIRWQTMAPELLVVSENGTVRPADGDRTGEAAIVATSKTDASQRASALIKVRYLTTKIDLAYDKTTVAPGGTLAFGATVTYTNPDDRGRVVFTDTSKRELTWSSSDKTRVQVDTMGQLRALADATPGDVTITAQSAYDPSVSEKVVVKVAN